MAKVHPFGHESPGVNTGMVLKVVGVLFGTIVVVLIVLYFTATNGLLGHHAQVVRRPDVIPPPPRLQSHPDNDLAHLRRLKREKLSRYAWDGPAHRFAQIPIQRAMQLYVKKQGHVQHAPPHKGGKP